MKDLSSSQPGEIVGYTFGPFVLDPVRRLLWREAQHVPVTSRIFDILLYLIENRDRLVTKDELLDHIWYGVIVEEGTLVRQVSNLRKALHERPDQHEYLVTIPGRGYRFVARVEHAHSLPDAPDHLTPRTESAPSSAPGGAVAAISADRADPVSIAGISRRPRGWRIAALATGAAVLVAIAGAMWTPETVKSSEPARLTQITFGPGLQQEPTWAPDGDALAFSSDQAGNFDIWVQWLTETTPVRVTTSESQDWQPDWSPDGKWIVFRSERDGGGLYVIGAQGGVERRIADFGYRPRWSPDGRQVLFSETARFSGESPRLYVVKWPDGQPVAVGSQLAERYRSVHAAWHPSGDRISVYGRTRQATEFVTLPLDGGPAVYANADEIAARLAEVSVTFGRFVWSRSGREIFFEGRADNTRNLWSVTVDPDSMRWTGPVRRLTTGAGQDGHLALSPDRSKLAFAVSSVQTRLWSFPFNTVKGTLEGEGTPITLGGDHDLGPDASPVGDKVLYRIVRGQKGELRELSLTDGRDQLIRHESSDAPVAVRYSPDGRRMAYVRTTQVADNRTRRGGLVISALGGGLQEEVNLLDVRFSPTDWSSDGNWLAGACRSAGAPDLAACLIPVSGRHESPRVPRVVASRADFNLFQERFSPDLRWLAFMAEPSDGAGNIGIYVVSLAAESRWTPVVEDQAFNDKPRWAPNGRAIYYLSDRGGFLNLWGRRFDPERGEATGEPFRVTAFDSPRRMISKDLIGQVEVAIAADRLVLPLTEGVGKVWILEGFD